jgi:hypothetical protein
MLPYLVIKRKESPLRFPDWEVGVPSLAPSMKRMNYIELCFRSPCSFLLGDKIQTSPNDVRGRQKEKVEGGSLYSALNSTKSWSGYFRFHHTYDSSL